MDTKTEFRSEIFFLYFLEESVIAAYYQPWKNMKNTLLILVLSSLLSACNTVLNPFSKNDAYSGISPPKIHIYEDDIIKTGPDMNLDKQVKMAEQLPYLQYYASLNRVLAFSPVASNANTKGEITAVNQTPIKVGDKFILNDSIRKIEEKEAMSDFIDKGIAVVNTSCVRWFRILAESQMRYNYTQTNQNVIQNLGTTLLGFGNANPLVMGTYGALFTALNGVENNFSQAFLLAPNSNKVKEHILSALDLQAEKLKSNNSMTYSQAYTALERYADICTAQTAKEIINSSLDQTKTVVKPEEGNRISTTFTGTDKQLQENIHAELNETISTKTKELKNLKEQKEKVDADNKQLSDSAKKVDADYKQLAASAKSEKEALEKAISDLNKKIQELNEK
jgi:hypothetical protein